MKQPKWIPMPQSLFIKCVVLGIVTIEVLIIFGLSLYMAQSWQSNTIPRMQSVGVTPTKPQPSQGHSITKSQATMVTKQVFIGLTGTGSNQDANAFTQLFLNGKHNSDYQMLAQTIHVLHADKSVKAISFIPSHLHFSAGHVIHCRVDVITSYNDNRPASSMQLTYRLSLYRSPNPQLNGLVRTCRQVHDFSNPRAQS